MNFFTVEDFLSEIPTHYDKLTLGEQVELMIDIANNKIEREASVVYYRSRGGWMPEDGTFHPRDCAHKALIINIEEIKSVCEHPAEKLIGLHQISLASGDDRNIIKYEFTCECGERVRATRFEAIKK